MAIVIIPGVGKVDNVTGKKVIEGQPIKPVTTVPGVGQVGPNGQVVVQSQNNGIPVPKVNPPKEKINPQTSGNATTDLPVAPQIGSSYSNDNYGYINKLSDAQAAASYNKLKNAYTTTMGNIKKEEATIDPTYQAEKQKATGQSELQKLNFAQYLQSRGIGSGGQMQSELSRQSALGNTLGTLQTNKQKALDAIATRKTDAANSFATDWANYQAQSNIDKAKAIQSQKLSDQKAKNDAAAAKAKADSAYALAIAKMNNATNNAQIRANATLTAAQIKANTAAQKKLDAAAKDVANKKSPTYVDKMLISQLGTKDTVSGAVGISEQAKPSAGKIILTSGMTPQQQYNMMLKYGIVSGNGKNQLGPVNSKRFVQNVLSSSMSKKEKAGYLSKLGIKTQEDVNRILKGK